MLELRASDIHLQVLGAGGVGRDERQIDAGVGLLRQIFLGLLARFLEALQGHGILAQVDAILVLKLAGHIVDQHLVEVVAAQVGIAVGGLDLEDAVADVEDGDIERAAAQVEDGDLFIFLFVEAIGQRCGRRLVDDAHALLGFFAVLAFDVPFGVEAGDLGRVDGRLALGIVEICRDGDDRLANGVPEIGLGGFLELAQDHGADFGRRELLAVDIDFDKFVGAADDFIGDDLLFGLHLVVAPAHEPLDRINGAARIGDCLAFGRVADEPIALVGEGHHAGGQALAFLIGDNFDFAAFHHGDDGVGGAKIDADDFFFRHWKSSFLAGPFRRDPNAASSVILFY